MDIIYIRGLQVKTIIGIFDWEREKKQTVCINLEMAADLKKAASSDKIEDAVDYKAVSDRLESFIADSEFQLIETLAENLSTIVLEEFNVQWLRLSLAKPEAIAHVDVGLVIERGVLDSGVSF